MSDHQSHLACIEAGEEGEGAEEDSSVWSSQAKNSCCAICDMSVPSGVLRLGVLAN